MKYKIAKYNKGERSMNKLLKNKQGVTLIAFAISRKCVRYEERA